MKLDFHSTDVENCTLVVPRPFEDNRGLLMVTYDEAQFTENGMPIMWKQENVSYSNRGVIRGLHIQNKNSQGKLVRCLAGEIRDVCIDVRPRSKTFGKGYVIDLSAKSGVAMYLPPGTLHGFAVLSESAIVHYKMTTLYHPGSDGGVRFDDPELGIDWGVETPVVSEKDQNLPTLKEFLEARHG